VRQDSFAWKYAHPRLRGDPALQPDRVLRNVIAAPGTHAPVVNIVEISTGEGGDIGVVVSRLSGAWAKLQLGGAATIGDLAREAVRRLDVHGGLLHLSGLGGGPVRPLDAERPLAEAAAAGGALPESDLSGIRPAARAVVEARLPSAQYDEEDTDRADLYDSESEYDDDF